MYVYAHVYANCIYSTTPEFLHLQKKKKEKYICV